jgi:hypothetical protein
VRERYHSATGIIRQNWIRIIKDLSWTAPVDAGWACGFSQARAQKRKQKRFECLGKSGLETNISFIARI